MMYLRFGDLLTASFVMQPATVNDNIVVKKVH